jgi:hypothetical protein
VTDDEMHAEMARLWPLYLGRSPWLVDQGRRRSIPKLVIRRRDGDESTGVCYTRDRRIVVSLARGEDRSGSYATLAHELAHAVTTHERGHGVGFWSVFALVAGDAYGARITPDEVLAESDRFMRHDVIEAEIRSAMRRADGGTQ